MQHTRTSAIILTIIVILSMSFLQVLFGLNGTGVGFVISALVGGYMGWFVIAPAFIRAMENDR